MIIYKRKYADRVQEEVAPEGRGEVVIEMAREDLEALSAALRFSEVPTLIKLHQSFEMFCGKTPEDLCH
jgi:hypothetical protein